MDDPNNFLESGPQTEITSRIRAVAEDIGGEGWPYVFDTIQWMRENLKDVSGTEGWKDLFRSRTADGILADGTTTGCGDTAVVFCALMRARVIPAAFYELPYRSWMEGENDGRFENHDIAQVYLQGRWFWVDPTRGTAGEGRRPDPVAGGISYVFMAKGLDSWDIGIRSWDGYKSRYLAFRKEWKSGLAETAD